MFRRAPRPAPRRLPSPWRPLPRCRSSSILSRPTISPGPRSRSSMPPRTSGPWRLSWPTSRIALRRTQSFPNRTGTAVARSSFWPASRWRPPAGASAGVAIAADPQPRPPRPAGRRQRGAHPTRGGGRDGHRASIKRRPRRRPSPRAPRLKPPASIGAAAGAALGEPRREDPLPRWLERHQVTASDRLRLREDTGRDRLPAPGIGAGWAATPAPAGDPNSGRNEA